MARDEFNVTFRWRDSTSGETKEVDIVTNWFAVNAFMDTGAEYEEVAGLFGRVEKEGGITRQEITAQDAGSDIYFDDTHAEAGIITWALEYDDEED